MAWTSIAVSSSFAYPLNTVPLPDEPNFPNVTKVVYRADMTPPEDIRRAGGILSRGMDGSRPNQPPPDTSLYNHVNGLSTGTSPNSSGYVATTETLGLARWWVNNYLNHNGYVYYIASSANFIPVNDALRQYSSHSVENEYAALGMVRFNQILGWRRSTSEIGPFIHNPAYNPTLYNRPTHPAMGDDVVRLAGFPDNFPAWGQEPWVSFATCELRYSCSPEENSLHVAEDYMSKSSDERQAEIRRGVAIFMYKMKHRGLM